MRAPEGVITLTWTDPVTGEPFEDTVTLPATIGRAADNTIVLASEMVSRHHARLTPENGHILLTDSSSNGTFVNGERQQRAVLTGGEGIQIGPYALTMRASSATASQVALTWTDPASSQPMRQTFTLPLVIGRGSGSGLVLNDTQVSRAHATLAAEDGQIVVTDSSSNGTFVNGARQQRAALHDGDQLRIGGTTLTVSMQAAAAARSTPRRAAMETVLPMDDATRIDSHPDQSSVAQSGATVLPGARGAAPPVTADDGRTVLPSPAARRDQTVLAAPVRQTARQFPPAIFNEPYVSVSALAQTGYPVYTTTYAALGGGLGSFIFTDHLLIYGVNPNAIISLGIFPVPYQRYATLARNSQIPLYERLRSNTESTPDNIWGTPGYAAREAVESLKSGHWGNAIQVLWQVLGEPAVAQTYTPRAGDVFRSLDNEAKRIGWQNIWRFGRMRAIRKTDDGRYVIAYSQSDDQRQSYAFLVANYVHLATGYPALQFLPDLQEYRERTGDFEHVVNGYEAHDYVYERLEQHGGVVLLRGRGIVASRLIQRIYEARKKNPNIAILHLLRTPIVEGHKFRRARRKAIHHVEIQPFNWPKATWGGEQRLIMEKADPELRKSLLADWGGTTTAQRADWVRIVDDGLKEGWYKIEFGDVIRVDPTADGRVATHVTMRGLIAGSTELIADYIVDATGLDAKVNRNPLLQDLVDHHHLQVNSLGRLVVTNDMDVPEMRNGPGRFYAAGSMTLGGPLPGADSFLGLTGAAQLTIEHLVREHAPGVRPLGPLRSFSQWLKWMRGVAP